MIKMSVNTKLTLCCKLLLKIALFSSSILFLLYKQKSNCNVQCTYRFHSFWNFIETNVKSYEVVEKRKISYFGLALNLFQHLISPNQNDFPVQPGPSFPACKTGERPNPVSLVWDGDQNRRSSDRPYLAMLVS